MLFTLMTIMCFADAKHCTDVILERNLKAAECQLILDVGISSIDLPDGTKIDATGMSFVCALQPMGEPV